MKVAIVSTPRTCSSFLTELFASGYGLTNHSEIFSVTNEFPEGTPETEQIALMRETDGYVVKITSTSFLMSDGLDYETFPWDIFDKIILVERDIVKQIASWHVLSCSQRQDIHTIEGLEQFLKEASPEDLAFNPGEMEYMLKAIIFYQDELKPYLLTAGLNDVRLVDYSLFQDRVPKYHATANEILGTNFPMAAYAESGGNRNNNDYTEFIEASYLIGYIEDVLGTMSK